jgi:hypothetical protein
MAIALGRPTEFAKWPPKNEDIAAGIRIVETTSPWTVEVSLPNVLANWGMVVMGPMVPVSRLLLVSFNFLYQERTGHFYPKRAPPMEIRHAASTYLGMWIRVHGLRNMAMVF